MLRVQKTQTIEDIEILLRELAGYGACDLLLTTTARDEQFGGRAALLQLLITWAKSSDTNRLVTYAQKDSDATQHARAL